MSKKNVIAATTALLAAVAVIALPGCSNDDEIAQSNYPSDNIVRIAANVNDMATRASYDTNSLAEMGLCISNSNSETYTYNNIKMSKSSNLWTSATQMLWQNPTQAVTILAYAPYNSEYTGTIATATDYPVSVQTTQTATDNASDFLVKKITNFVPGTQLNTNGAVDIAMNHALSQLTLTIKLGTEFDVPEQLTSSPVQDLKVSGTITTGTCDFTAATPTVTVSPAGADVTAKDVTPYESAAFVKATGNNGQEVTNATATYSCILIPQTVAVNGFVISFTVNGKTYQWKSPAAVTLAAGKSHSLELTVGKDIVVAKGMSAKPWTEGTTSNLSTD